MAKIVKIAKRDLLDSAGKVIGDYVTPVLDNGEELSGMTSADFFDATASSPEESVLSFSGPIKFCDETTPLSD